VKKTALAACPACARHLRVNEPACPFCRAELPPWFRELTAPATPATRLSRAALYALRVGALSVTTVACGGAISTGSGSGEKDAGSSDGTTVGQAAYGGSPPEEASADSGGEDVLGTLYGGFIGGPAYGGTFSIDAGVDDATTGFEAAYGGFPPPSDAGSTDANSRPDVIHVAPPYGGFPADEKPE